MHTVALEDERESMMSYHNSELLYTVQSLVRCSGEFSEIKFIIGFHQ